MFKSTIISIILTTTFLVFSGCSSGGGGSGSSNAPEAKADVSYELEQGTVIVESSKAEEMSVVPEINASNYTDSLVFKAPDSGIFSEYKVGDTMMSGVSDKAPYGFLRKITKIEEVGGELVITTVQGTLLEATNNLEIDYNSANITPDAIASIQLVQGVVLENMNLDNSGKILSVATTKGDALFDISIDHTFTHDGGDVTVSGRTTFDFGIIFKLRTEYLVIPEYFKTSIVIDQGTRLSIVSNNGIDYKDDISLGSIQLAPISLGAVVIVPKIDLVLRADGKVQANFAVSASESFHGEIGVEYKRDRSPSWEPINENVAETDYALPNLESVNAYIKVNAGPEFSLMVYGVVGPYMFLSGFGELDVSAVTPPNLDLTLDVGVEYELGVKVEILWIDRNYELASDDLFRVNVLKLENELIPDAVYLTDPMEGEFILYGPVKKITTTHSGVLPDRVDFLIDGTTIGIDSVEPYEIDWDTNTTELGTHTVKIVSYDASGNELANDSAQVDLREAKWRESSMSGITSIGHSDFSYGTGYVFGLSANNLSSVIQKTTNGGKTWSVYLEEPIGVFTLAPLKKGFMKSDGTLIGLEILSTNLYSMDGIGRTKIFDGFGGEYSGVRDFGLDNSGNIIAILDKGGYPYMASISMLGVATDLDAVEDNSGNPAVLGTAAVEFSRVSEDAIVYDTKAIDETTGTMNSGFMISHNSGSSWSWQDFNGVDFGFLDTIDGAYFISTDEIVLVGTTYIDVTDYDDPLSVIQLLPNSAFVVKTTDGGVSWQRVDVPGAKGFNSVTFFNDKEGFASVYAQTNTAEPKVYKTDNGGLIWVPVDEVSTTQRIVRVQFSNEYSGVAVGDEGDVFRFALD